MSNAKRKHEQVHGIKVLIAAHPCDKYQNQEQATAHQSTKNKELAPKSLN